MRIHEVQGGSKRIKKDLRGSRTICEDKGEPSKIEKDLGGS